jgi:methyl-accepting chemotaxis protein
MDQLPTVLSRRGRLRRSFVRLSYGLILYGVAGMLVAAVGLAMLVGTGAAVGSFGVRVEGESEQLGTTLRETAVTLDEAAQTAESFGRTLEQTPPSVRQVAATVRNLRPRLEAIQSQAAAIDILGTRPLQGISELFGQIASDLAGLDDQLDRIADELGANQTSLGTNAASLARLSDEVSGFADRLDAGLVTDSLEEIRAILALVLAILVIALALPAAGSLALGLWLRREFGEGRPVRPVIVVER